MSDFKFIQYKFEIMYKNFFNYLIKNNYEFLSFSALQNQQIYSQLNLR